MTTEQETSQATAGPGQPEAANNPGQPRNARIAIEVVAGLIPGGEPEPEFTQRYVILSDDWAKAKEDPTGLAVSRLLAETNGRALGYAGLLMLQPDRVNWVRTDWIYF